MKWICWGVNKIMDDACIFSLGPWESDNLLIEFARKEN